MSEQNKGYRQQPRRGHGPMGPGGMGMPVEKPKHFKKTFFRLLRYLRPYMLRIVIVFAFAIASTVFAIWGPKVSGYAITSLMNSVVAKQIVTQMSQSNDKQTAKIKQQTQGYVDSFKTYGEAYGNDIKSFYTTLAALSPQSVSKEQMAALQQGGSAQGSGSSSLTAEQQMAALQQQTTAMKQQLAGMNQVLAAIQKASAMMPAAQQKQLTQMDAYYKDAQEQYGQFSALATKVKKVEDTANLLKGVPSMADAKTNTEKAAAYDAMVQRIKKLTPAQYQNLKNMMKDLSSGSSISGVASFDQIRNMSLYNEQFSFHAIKETGGTVDFSYIWSILMMLISLYVISAACMFVQQYMMSHVSQRTVYQLRRDLDEKLARLPLKYYDSRTNGEILSRMTNDIDTISTTLQQSVTQVITAIVQIVGYIVMMLTISPILTLIVMCTLPLYFGATIFIAKKSQKYFAAQQKELGRLSGHVEEMYTGHKIVKAFGHEQQAIDEFEDVNKRLYGAGWKSQFISGVMFPFMNFISNIGYVAIAVVGGIFVANKKLVLGDITAFIQYSRSFTQPIIQTANIANVIQSTIACAERVFEVLDEEEELPDAPDARSIEAPKGAVRFEDVRFGYSPDNILMQDMNIDVQPGQTIAVVGPTGAGKTTLVNLLMRFYEIGGGRITFDGVDIRTLKRASLRTMFGMVLQDTWLFNGTIRENIAYGRENATDEEIYAAARTAHADHFIRTLPEGYDTVLNEEATNISQGQKQLLTIARAFLADPAVLILDEATSSVDTRTELLIQKAMEKLMKGRTNFVIAHRLSTIRDADLILVMNHGTIVEKGTHKELLEKGGFYADLYNSQFAGPQTDGEAV